jgi:hypothetical protein
MNVMLQQQVAHHVITNSTLKAHLSHASHVIIHVVIAMDHLPMTVNLAQILSTLIQLQNNANNVTVLVKSVMEVHPKTVCLVEAKPILIS